MTRFSVRDLFFVITIAGILCGWWLDRSHIVADADKAKADVAQANKATAEAVRQLRQANFLIALEHAKYVPWPDTSTTKPLDIATENAIATAQNEVMLREEWKSISSSEILGRVDKPTGAEFVVVVWREPMPGAQRYVTVADGKVIDYKKGK